MISLFNREKYKLYLIKRNNNKVLKKLKSKKLIVKNILLLLPHCLQNVECLFKVTWDKLENCRRCGKCIIPEFIDLKNKYNNIFVTVVTGGTAAREIIKKEKPDLIVAVACENDLTSGIKDVKKIPVLAVLNERPEGPCKNTTVNINKIKEYLNLVFD